MDCLRLEKWKDDESSSHGGDRKISYINLSNLLIIYI